MKTSKYLKALRSVYSPISEMKKRYPKAAKKTRIITKWTNRFGPDVDLSTIVYKENFLLKLLPYQEWGGYFPVPIVLGEDDEQKEKT